MHIMGKNITKRDLETLTGAPLAQCVREFRFSGGMADGMRGIELASFCGLHFTVLPDRGLDIGDCSLNGLPIGWRSSAQMASPEFFTPESTEFGRLFHGGLLTTCGLTQAGDACEIEGRIHPVHGEYSFLKAESVSLSCDWDNERPIAVISGKVTQSRLYKERLVLDRKILFPLDGNRIEIRDCVENTGFAPVPLMLVYHINFGWPLLSDGSHIELDAIDTTGDGDYRLLGQPSLNAESEEWHHNLRVDIEGYSHARTVNPGFASAEVSFLKSTLPYLHQWKFLRTGEYVLALEPCNTFILGQEKEKENGTLEFIQPGERREFRVAIEIAAAK
ncbi:MAG: aldose 1-epimerase family protein [Clostridia bacterium]|nr:aldose 1-epimerase family protein [Clostridia bacterium]